MPKPKDLAEVIATIKESIEASPRKSRKVRFHNLRDKFGWQSWTAQRKELVAALLKERDILAQPPIAEAGLDDWIQLSMPIISDLGTKDPIAPPGDKFFAKLMAAHLGPEREVELHFVTKLFHALDYEDEQEAAGFGFILHEGVSKKHVEADFIYFDDEERFPKGKPLVLVEAKSSGHKLDAATEQARSYANTIKPMYYAVTNGDLFTLWNYQGPIPDVKVLEFKRSEVQARFDEIYRVLNHETVAKEYDVKLKKWHELGHAN